MEIGGTTILGNTHTYIYINIYIYTYTPFTRRNTTHLSYRNHLQYCLPPVFRDIPRTSFLSAPAQLIQAHFTLKKRLGLGRLKKGRTGRSWVENSCPPVFVEEKVETDSWLVVFHQPILKNMRPSKMGSSSPSFRVKIPKMWKKPPTQEDCPCYLWASKLRRISWAANKINGGVDPNKLLRDDDLSGMIHPPSYVTRLKKKTS